MPTQPGFDDSLRRHLVPEQIRAVLEVIGTDLDAETTLGEVIDAAEDLGWGEAIGSICLADLAHALHGGAPPAAAPLPPVEAAGDDQDEPDERDEEEGDDDHAAAVQPQRPRGRPSPAGKKAAKKVSRAKAPAKPARPAKPATRLTKPAPARPERKRVSLPDDPDAEALSLEQAAKLLLPLVRKLKEATMQELEDTTGMGRRKLRFHIGQLVKHGRLHRHGMGRGTFYTLKK